MRRIAGAILVAVLALAPLAVAQPLPDTIASSGLTRAQQRELERRLGQLQGRFNALARETDLREAALQNVAVEIFGAQPELDFETYVGLIETGARQLREYISEARGRNETDPALAALRQQALAAAEQGRLSEARTLYDQLIARSTESLEARWARQDREREAERNAARLAVAIDMGEAARLAFVSADYLDAARRYGEASARAPEGARERWEYKVEQANALRVRGSTFVEPAPIAEAVRVLQEEALPLAPRASKPYDWATTQTNLGLALDDAASRQDGGAALAHQAAASYRAALEVFDRRVYPEEWRHTQAALAETLASLGRAGSIADLQEAQAIQTELLNAAPRETNELEWARTQQRLAYVLYLLAHRGDVAALPQSIAAYDAAIQVFERTGVSLVPVQRSLGMALNLAAERGDEGAAARAVPILRAAAAGEPRSANPQRWALVQIELASAVSHAATLGADRDRAREGVREAISIYRGAHEVFTRTTAPYSWAQVSVHLGMNYQYLAQLSLGAERDTVFAQSIAAHTAALEVWTRDSYPSEWAIAHQNMGATYLTWSRTDQSKRADALAAFRSALPVYEQIGDEFGARTMRTQIRALELVMN